MHTDSPNHTIMLENMKIYCPWNTNGLKGSEGGHLHLGLETFTSQRLQTIQPASGLE